MDLKCCVQTYAWGKSGIESAVATLYKSANPDFEVDESTSYAELWMGTHPNGPCFLKDKNQSLDEYIKANPQLLGDGVQKSFGSQLPFLFKVLSVNKALSIQVHPNKEQAEKLHRAQPEIYKDPNHKPEIAVALTPFEALCGFRPLSEILLFLQSLPELQIVLGENSVAELTGTDEVGLSSVLKRSIQSLMQRDAGIVAVQLKKLIERLATLDQSTRQMLNAGVLERIHSDFPGDVGCFGIYIFNYITLQPGEAMYLGANEPHAYLSGDCIECMAESDNVIRAGLTPKLKDVPALIEMLSYHCEPASAKKYQPCREDECTEIFRPPVPDFAVAKITVPPGRPTYNLIPRSTASILIIINGKAEIAPSRILNRGSVLFIPANEKISMKILCGCHPMLMFQALANV